MKLEPSRQGKELAARLQREGVRSSDVLQAIARTPRQLFVDDALSYQAWENTALPIGLGQTISQPYIVARMTELALDKQPQQLLEIGTGSGYQTAILAQLAPHVFSVERIRSLQLQARRRLQKLDLHNISYRHADGWQGWGNKAPFDAILVTAAAPHVPQALLDQLADGGRLVIPVGDGLLQHLLLIERVGEQFHQQTLEAVRFVPLVNGDLQ